MRRFIKFITVAVMLAVFLLGSVGCDKIDEVIGGIGGASASSFTRLTSVTVVRDGESQSYSVSWTENGCSFANGDGLYSFVFDKESFTLTLKWENEELPIFEYDSNGRIILIYNEDNPSETFEVSYDDNGCPVIDGETLKEYNPADKTLTIGKGGGGERDEEGNGYNYTNYHIRTYGDKGQILSVDKKTVTTYSDGRVEEKVSADAEKYTYDENGNMITYQNKYVQILFTYSNEKISHEWERILPVTYIDFFSMFDLPLFWNLK